MFSIFQTRVPGQIDNEIKPANESAFYEPYETKLQKSTIPEADW